MNVNDEQVSWIWINAVRHDAELIISNWQEETSLFWARIIVDEEKVAL